MDEDCLDYNELLIKGYSEKATKRREAWAAAFRRVSQWLKDIFSVPEATPDPREKIENGDYASMDTH